MLPRTARRTRLGPGAEFDLIRRFLPSDAPPVRPDVWVGPGDDCAVVAGNGIALSSDLCVEGVHFRRDWLEPEEIGWRAASAALSDLAAVAARPVGVLASLAVSAADADDFAAGVMTGVRGAAEAAGGLLLGGDLSRTEGPAVLDVVVVGECPLPVMRAGAERGDEIWVTGELGAPAAAVARLLRGDAPSAEALERFARPAPRLAEAAWLRERELPKAMIDLSDGLAADAGHLAAAACAAILLSPGTIPVHAAALADASSPDEALAWAVGGGEEYELCFASAPGTVEGAVDEFQARFGLRLTCVGRVAGGDGVWWTDAEGHRSEIESPGWVHFSGDDAVPEQGGAA